MDINDKNRRISRINMDDDSIWAIPLPPTKLMVPSYTKLENEERLNTGSSWKTILKGNLGNISLILILCSLNTLPTLLSKSFKGLGNYLGEKMAPRATKTHSGDSAQAPPKAPKLKRKQKRVVAIARAYSETATPHLQQELQDIEDPIWENVDQANSEG